MNVAPKFYVSPAETCKNYDETTGQCVIGRYTQVMSSRTTHIGCAAVACKSGLFGQGGSLLICKYSPNGNFKAASGLGRLQAPFLLGAKCAACPGKCMGGLCQPESKPVRCLDDITMVTTNFSNVVANFTSCSALIDYTKTLGAGHEWCSHYESTRRVCQLSCGVCTRPDGIGMEFCGQDRGFAVLPTTTTTTTPIITTTTTPAEVPCDGSQAIPSGPNAVGTDCGGIVPEGRRCRSRCQGGQEPLGEFWCSQGLLLHSSFCSDGAKELLALFRPKVAWSFSLALAAKPTKNALRAAVAAALIMSEAHVDRLAVHASGDRRLAAGGAQARRADGTSLFTVDAEAVVPSDLTVNTIISRARLLSIPSSKPQKALVQHLRDFGAMPNTVQQILEPRTFQALVINSTQSEVQQILEPAVPLTGSEDAGELGLGAIIGGSVGGAVGLVACITLACCLCKKENKFEA